VTPALLDSPASLFADHATGGAPDAAAERLGGGRVTLEERLNAALHAARTNDSTECPVCRAHMTGEAGAAAATCGGCGSRLT
jgi:hypothetical protein